MQRFTRVPETLAYHDLFPEKNKNFYQCPMKVVLYNLPPFMELSYRNNQILFQGFDAEILKDLAEYLNFSIEVKLNEPENYIGGDVFKNNTAVGIFKLLVERKANISIGFISCLSKRLQFTTGSTPYFLTEILIVFKNYPKYKPIQLLLRPFSSMTWICILTILILRPILKYLLYTNLNLRPSFRRLLRIQYIFLIFLLRILYEGSMFQAIRNSPHKYLPLTVDEVVQHNYSLITDYATARILQEINYIKNVTTIVEGNPEAILESLDDLPPNTGVLCSDTILAVFMRKRRRNYDDYAILRDKVSNTMSCIFFPRLSFLVPQVNNLLNHYRIAGIFEKYKKEFAYENLPISTDQLRTRSNLNAKKSLDFIVLKSVFRVLSILHLISLLVFILELLSLRCRFLQCMMRYIHGI